MARLIPADRFPRLIEVATHTFIARGYRFTQMADVAEALGVAKGTLYGYVESKEALFDAAIRLADGQAPMPEPSTWPLRTPDEGATVRFIQERLMTEVQQLLLVQVLSRPSSTRPPAGEFESIIRDLHTRVSRNRRALKLVDRCAVDHPELAAVWFQQGRYGLVALLATYLEQHMRAGSMRPIAHVQLAARMVLETVALWSIHMPWDPAPRAFSEDDVATAVADLLVHAYQLEEVP